MESINLSITTHSPKESQEWGRLLGQIVPGGMVIALTGDLGAGKTTFTQGLARGMGIGEAVTSPTFVLISEYAARDGLTLVHVDLYRLDSRLGSANQEVIGLGLLDYLQDMTAVVIIEWADRMEQLLPESYMTVQLEQIGLSADGRQLTFNAHGSQATQLLLDLERSCHLVHL